MEVARSRVNAKGQVIIPKSVRDALGIHPHDEVIFYLRGDTLILRPRPKSYTETLRGLYADIWHQSDAWLEEERNSWE